MSGCRSASQAGMPRRSAARIPFTLAVAILIRPSSLIVRASPDRATPEGREAVVTGQLAVRSGRIGTALRETPVTVARKRVDNLS